MLRLCCLQLRLLPLLPVLLLLLLQRRRLCHLHHIAGHGSPLTVRLAPPQLHPGAGGRRQVQRVDGEGQAGQRFQLRRGAPPRAALVVDGAAAEGVAVAGLQASDHCRVAGDWRGVG